ncbi:hypothetical protein [Paenirhodobacter hankyongi]|uniref:Uncharacterized protein n=1 Tax=Paenirhodobacter hankyongi TaxID=2294033 RepID=A0A421BSR8_9RHOB|nr:hypothetical protein [Sinirhodobacter hankyongi]RLL71292.1 hypothetical protein DYS74_05275 [Sinirhodobacter hankyongi]
MFLITLSPMRRDDTLAVSVAGDVLTLNGAALDLGALAPGESLPCDEIGCEWIASDIVRGEGGEIALTLILPHGAEATDARRFPQPVTVTADGPVALD